jgi:hypothetical protein
MCMQFSKPLPPKGRSASSIIAMAEAVTALTRKKLAKAIGMSYPTMLRVEDGSAVLDMQHVSALSKLLDLPAGFLAEMLSSSDDDHSCPFRISFEKAYELSRLSYSVSRYHLTLRFAKIAHKKATTGDERAWAFIREAGGHDGTGEYAKAIVALQGALDEVDISPSARMRALANLAYAHLMHDDVEESESLVRGVVESFEKNAPCVVNPPSTIDGGKPRPHDRMTQAWALFVLGMVVLRRVRRGQPGQHALASEGIGFLKRAIELHQKLKQEFKEYTWIEAINHTSEAALLELQVELQPKSVFAALQPILETLKTGGPKTKPRGKEIQKTLKTRRRNEKTPRGEEIQSRGWRALSAIYLLRRHAAGKKPEIVEHALNVAFEAASALNHWGLFEQWYRQARVTWDAGDEAPVLSEKQRRVLVGLMHRYERHREKISRLLSRTNNKAA